MPYLSMKSLVQRMIEDFETSQAKNLWVHYWVPRARAQTLLGLTSPCLSLKARSPYNAYTAVLRQLKH